MIRHNIGLAVSSHADWECCQYCQCPVCGARAFEDASEPGQWICSAIKCPILKFTPGMVA